jgi:hypothetical protein
VEPDPVIPGGDAWLWAVSVAKQRPVSVIVKQTVVGCFVRDQKSPTTTVYAGTVANACVAAAIVCATSFLPWAAPKNAASNCDGGR